MIITLEDDGQPRLDSISDKKVPLDILLPEQSYYPNYSTHAVLRNIHGYVPSTSTVSDAGSITTGDFRHTDSSTSNPKKLWGLFTFPFKRQKSSVDPFMSESTVVEKPGKPRKLQPLPLSWSELSKKWLLGWFLLSLILCAVVSYGVWIAARRADRSLLFQNMNTEWAVEDTNIYTLTPERFGCYEEAASTTLNGSSIVFTMPTGLTHDHTFIVRGGASGLLTIASSPDLNATSIVYDLVIHGVPATLDKVVFDKPGPDDFGSPSTTFSIDTPTFVAANPGDVPPCMRFDITMYVPRGLNKLTINITTPVQLVFSSQAQVELDSLVIGLTSSHPKCRVDVSESLHAKSMNIDMYTGLIHGLISIGSLLQITNWNGRIEVDAIPNVVPDIIFPPTAFFTTITGHGKVDIRYLRNTAYRKRVIESYHTMGTDMGSCGRFDYSFSGFNGLLFTNSTNYNLTNAAWEARPTDALSTLPIVVGNRTGNDRIYIMSGSGSIILPDNS